MRRKSPNITETVQQPNHTSLKNQPFKIVQQPFVNHTNFGKRPLNIKIEPVEKHITSNTNFRKQIIEQPVTSHINIEKQQLHITSDNEIMEQPVRKRPNIISNEKICNRFSILPSPSPSTSSSILAEASLPECLEPTPFQHIEKHLITPISERSNDCTLSSISPMSAMSPTQCTSSQYLTDVGKNIQENISTPQSKCK